MSTKTISTIITLTGLGIIITTLTGLGILTTSIFKIEECNSDLMKSQESIDKQIEFMKQLPPDVFTNKDALLLNIKNTSLPKNINYTDKKIKLNDNEVLFTKISLISFWIIIIILIIIAMIYFIKRSSDY